MGWSEESSAGPREGRGPRIGAGDLPRAFRRGTSDYSSFYVFCDTVRGFSRGACLGRTPPADITTLSHRQT